MQPHPLRSAAAALVVLALTTTHAASQPVVSITWRFHAVGTPEFGGEPKIGKPGYVEPVPVDVKLPTEVPCSPDHLAVGEFEAYINSKGVVEKVHSHYEPISGNSCQRRYIFPVIKQWRFSPALFSGKPTPVFLWVGVSVK